jgi:hypothetical protein
MKNTKRVTKQLLMAIDNEDVNSLSRLANAGVNLEEFYNGWFGNYSLLMHAIESRKYIAAQFLVEAGADVNVKDFFGRTALIDLEYPSIVDLLIEYI